MPEYLTTSTALDLDVDLIRIVRDNRHYQPCERTRAANALLDHIERQLTPEEREKLKEGNNND